MKKTKNSSSVQDRKSSKDAITKADIDFIVTAMIDHNSLVSNHHSCLWEQSMQDEIDRMRVLEDNILKMSKYGTKIDGQDFVFLEFKLKERADFADENIGPIKNVSARTTKLIEKIRRLCNLPPDDQNMEYSLAVK